MAENETITSKQNGSKMELGRVSIHSCGGRGLEIFFQSNKSFRFLADESEKTFKLGGVDCYYPRNGNGYNLPGVMGVFRTEKETFLSDGFPNLSFLLARDLAKGVTFSFGTFPLSEEKLKEYAENLKAQIKLLFCTYMRDFTIDMTFSTAIVETEGI